MKSALIDVYLKLSLVDGWCGFWFVFCCGHYRIVVLFYVGSMISCDAQVLHSALVGKFI